MSICLDIKMRSWSGASHIPFPRDILPGRAFSPLPVFVQLLGLFRPVYNKIAPIYKASNLL